LPYDQLDGVKTSGEFEDFYFALGLYDASTNNRSGMTLPTDLCIVTGIS